MKKFEHNLGKFSFEIDEVEYSVKPKMGDKLKLLKMVKKHQLDETDVEGNKKIDEVGLLSEFMPFVCELLSRDDKDVDTDGVGLFVEDKFEQLLPKIFTGFKLGSEEDFAEKND